MTDVTSSPSFWELSVEARTLLFIYASAAWARYHSHIPSPTLLVTELEYFWCNHQLSAEAVSDPHRVTLLLKKHFESLHSDAVRRPAAKSKTSRLRSR
jgi:hypothetical protein